mmetsp:Transcript_9750/g.21715  ORF Transcript_9750/g.21715 Transcript_9750/m.21715 type:complete len:918 (-) Transcript_9750:1401-4154(-)
MVTPRTSTRKRNPPPLFGRPVTNKRRQQSDAADGGDTAPKSNRGRPKGSRTKVHWGALSSSSRKRNSSSTGGVAVSVSTSTNGECDDVIKVRVPLYGVGSIMFASRSKSGSGVGGRNSSSGNISGKISGSVESVSGGNAVENSDSTSTSSTDESSGEEEEYQESDENDVDDGFVEKKEKIFGVQDIEKSDSDSIYFLKERGWMVNSTLGRYTSPTGTVIKSLERALQHEHDSFPTGISSNMSQIKVVAPSHRSAPTNSPSKVSKKRPAADLVIVGHSVSDVGETTRTPEETARSEAKSNAHSNTKRLCNICNKWMSKIGFHKHYEKCKRWKCQVCDSVIPRKPGTSPNGLNSICSQCSTTHFENEKKKMKEKHRLKQQENITDAATKSLVIRTKPQTADTYAPVEKKQKIEKIILAEEKSEVYDDLDSDLSLDNRSGNKWTTRLECALLLAALNDKRQLYQFGPGLWMAKNKNQPSLSQFSGNDLSAKWHAMQKRRPGPTVAETPPGNRSRFVMAACFTEQGDYGSERDMARGVALLGAGWVVLPPTFGGKRASKKISSSRWIPPQINIDQINNEEYLASLAYNLETSWDNHIYELEQGFDNILKGIDEAEEHKNSDDSSVEGKQSQTSIYISQTEQPRDQTAGDDSTIQKVEDEINSYQAQANTADISAWPMSTADSRKHSSISKRSAYVRDGDPRPSMKCYWCGPKKLYTPDKPSPLCDACRHLKNIGWECYAFQRSQPLNNGKLHYDFKFNAPDRRPFKSVKMFLMESTKDIVPNGKDVVTFDTTIRDDVIDVVDVPAAPSNSELDDSVKDLSKNTIPRNAEDLRKLCDSFPTFEESLAHDGGLMGNLKTNYHDWKSLFNCTANDIAIWVLHRLSKGDISSAVQSEAPFFRPDDELSSFSDSDGPPTRFVGVIR